jgi:hypothetical protein
MTEAYGGVAAAVAMRRAKSVMESAIGERRSVRAERVILISLMKSGTHLLQELMVALGYGMYGQARIPENIKPALDADERWRIARMVYDALVLDELAAMDEAAFCQATDQAWEALAWSWQIRFGMPLKTWYSMELINTELVGQAVRRTAGSDFSQTPRGICWVFNEFDIKKLDGHFLHEWAETGEPRIIFNYRDPRDMMLSMVNFLAGRTGRGFSNFNDFHVFSAILKSKRTLDEQLTYALTDPSFPCHGDDFWRVIWLLNHPNVCKTSFEELVGPAGGGSAEARTSAVARILDFLGIADATPADVTDRLFNPEAFSFFRGQIGGWREDFSPQHRRLAEATYGEVLPLFGYA